VTSIFSHRIFLARNVCSWNKNFFCGGGNFFLAQEFVFLWQEKKSLLQEKNLALEKNCFVTMSRKHFHGDTNNFFGSVDSWFWMF